MIFWESPVWDFFWLEIAVSETATSRVIGAWVKDPTEPSIFRKAKKTDHAECRTISCSCDSCPLLAVGQCIETKPLGGGCPYGRYRIEEGPTGRSSKMWEWIRDRRAQHKDAVWPDTPPAKLAFIGGHVYLPYPHMDMCREVPFLRHSSLFVSGIDFILREAWTIDTVLTLIQFRPQALMGGEIHSYQQESVPKFIEHIRETDPAMWSELIAAMPQLNKAANHVGRKALLKTLAFPIDIPPKDSRYPVAWHWDGKVLSTKSVNAYSDTWGGQKPESISLQLTPRDDATVVVANNSWVTQGTVFVD